MTVGWATVVIVFLLKRGAMRIFMPLLVPTFPVFNVTPHDHRAEPQRT